MAVRESATGRGPGQSAAPVPRETARQSEFQQEVRRQAARANPRQSPIPGKLPPSFRHLRSVPNAVPTCCTRIDDSPSVGSHYQFHHPLQVCAQNHAANQVPNWDCNFAACPPRFSPVPLTGDREPLTCAYGQLHLLLHVMSDALNLLDLANQRDAFRVA